MLQVSSTFFFVTQSSFVMWGYEESGYSILCIYSNKGRYENKYAYTNKCQQENIKSYSKKCTKTIKNV